MFIKTTVFKRLLKQAYKRDLLQVGHEDNTNIYYIIGGYWAIMVEKGFLQMRPRLHWLNLSEICQKTRASRYIAMEQGSS